MTYNSAHLYVICYLRVYLHCILVMMLLHTPLDAQQSGIDNTVLVNAIEANMDKIVSGSYRFTNTIQDLQENTVIRGDGYCVFDFPKGLLRVDYSERIVSGGNPQSQLRTRGARYVLTPDYSIITNVGVSNMGGSDTVSYFTVSQQRPSDIRYFDFRILGYCMASDFITARSYSNFIKEMKFPVKSITSESNKIVKRVSVFNDKANKHTTYWSHWFDKSIGYMPVKSNLILHHDAETAQPDTEVHLTETTWQYLNSIYIPITFRCYYRHNINKTTTVKFLESVNIVITWEHVNGKVDPQLFTIEGLGLKEDQYDVIDHRLGKPVFLKKRGWARDVPFPEIRLSNESSKWNWLRLTLLGTVALTNFIVLYLIYISFRSRVTL
jgi:hypothetical protein